MPASGWRRYLIVTGRIKGHVVVGTSLTHLWVRLAKAVELPKGERFGWHSLRRKFASELRNTNLRDLCDLGGWKKPETVLTCYVRPDEDAQREALTGRGLTRKAAIRDPLDTKHGHHARREWSQLDDT
jgi:hypothetical protein